jgi:hypothetical protein
MPFRSEKQRRYLHIHNPKLAAEWERKYGSKPQASKKKRTAKKTTQGKRSKKK